MNDRNPLGTTHHSPPDGLGPGSLGVVMSRAGVGKTAFLVQVGLDKLAQGRRVLHISIGHSVGHVAAWYEAMMDDQASAVGGLGEQLKHQHIIHTLPLHTHLQAHQLEEILSKYEDVGPSVLLIDDWDWEGDVPSRAAQLNKLRATAKRANAEIWMSAKVHRPVAEAELTRVPSPCEPFQHLLDMVVFLESYAGAHVRVRMLKSPDQPHQERITANLNVEPDTISPLDLRAPEDLPASGFTLLSGGAPGAETEFGLCAERWGLTEQNFSYPGRQPHRTRGLVELSEAELREGDVSTAYVESQLKRSFPTTAAFKKTLQTIWYQVATAGEIFVVGLILPDNTVNGGTGWAVELGRRFNKNVYVFDQERREWFAWDTDRWTPHTDPKISTTRFAGTGTRFLSEEGRQAIHNLFQRTFGPSPR